MTSNDNEDIFNENDKLISSFTDQEIWNIWMSCVPKIYFKNFKKKLTDNDWYELSLINGFRISKGIIYNFTSFFDVDKYFKNTTDEEFYFQVCFLEWKLNVENVILVMKKIKYHK